MARRKSLKHTTEASEKDPCRHSKEYFNLIDEPWIPVVWKSEAHGLSGRSGPDALPSELGLRDTLLHAHEIAEVADQSPLVTAALHRLLIALVHAIYQGPVKRKDWGDLWQAAAFNPDKVRAYFEKWRPRFWLFHPERPFLQWSRNDLGEPRPSTLLNLATASGNNATLFDHSLDSAPIGFTSSEAARQLMAFLTFTPGGFVDGVSGAQAVRSGLAAPWADGAAFLSQGENLFATLMMNLMLHDSRNGIVSELGQPEWERAAPSPWTRPKQSVLAAPPQTYLELLTAPCRRIRLREPDSLGLIRYIRLQLGCVFNANAPVDPSKAYFADKKTGWRPIGLRADRALWRDSATLFRHSSADHAQPRSLAQLASLCENDILPDGLVVGLRAFGTVGSQAKLDLWRAEVLPIPLHILREPERLVLIEDCLRLAEEVEKALSTAVWILVCRLVPKSKEERERKALRDHLDVTRSFWTALETPFKRDVLCPSGSLDCEAVRLQWGDMCMATGRECLVTMLNGLASSAVHLRAGAEAERTLATQLKKLRTNHNLNEEKEHVETSTT